MAVVIPNIVHRLWLGDKKMPKEYVAYGKTWEKHGYEVRDWSESDLEPLINAEIWDAIGNNGVDVGGGNPEVGVAVQRADVASYELVYRYGGIYANTDMECLKPLDDTIDEVSAFAVREQDQWVGNALFGGTAGHPFWGAVIERLPYRYRMAVNRPMNEQTGPHLLTEVSQMRDDLTILPPGFAYPYLYGDMGKEGKPELWDDQDLAHCEHHWGHKHPELLA
jgi:mannosyltransferase OCH1-like enzyme